MTEDDDRSQILPTQLQSEIEESLNDEMRNHEQTRLKSSLTKYRHEGETSNDKSGRQSNTGKKLSKKPSSTSKKSSKKAAGSKNSMSDMVRQRYLRDKLRYFSGDQRKIDEFVKGEAGRLDEGDSEKKPSSGLFLKNEWLDVLKRIRLKFPPFSADHQTELPSSSKPEEASDNSGLNDGGIWSQACSKPEETLTNDDLMILHDISENSTRDLGLIDEEIHESGQIRNEDYVITLSQTLLKALGEDEDSEVILDSEEDIDALILNDRVEAGIKESLGTPECGIHNSNDSGYVKTSLGPPTSLLEGSDHGCLVDAESSLCDPRSTDSLEVIDDSASESIELLPPPTFAPGINDRINTSISRIKFVGDISIEEITKSDYKISKVAAHKRNLDADSEIEDSQDEFFDECDSILEINKVENIQGIYDHNAGKADILGPVFPEEDGQSVSHYNATSRSEDCTVKRHGWGGDLMTTSELRLYLKEVGFKPPRSRREMTEVLSRLYQIIQHSTSRSEVPPSSSQAREALFDVLRSTLKKEKRWFAKIVTFEPINITELREWLQSDNIEINIDIYILQSFCDDMGINYFTK